jgi:hypothetical protein
VLRLIGIEQRCQHIEAIALGRSAPGAPQAFDLGAGLLVVAFVRIGFSSFAMLYLSHVDPVEVPVRADPDDADDTFLEIGRNENSCNTACGATSVGR